MAIHDTKVTLKAIKSEITKSDSPIREAVANAIDADAKNIYIKVYKEQDKGSIIDFNYFCIDIADDGIGIPTEDNSFDEAFCRYKESPKKDKTNYGRKGKGRYTYLVAVDNINNLTIFTKDSKNWYKIKFEANEHTNIQISKEIIENKPNSKVLQDFTTLVQFKNIDVTRFELKEDNIDELINFIKSDVISFFADRVASQSVNIYINNELLKINTYLEKKVSETIKIAYEEKDIIFEVDFYIWNEEIKLKADRQKHILFIDDNKQLKGITPSGKHKLSIANQKQNHTVIVKSKYFDKLDYMGNNDDYNNILLDKIVNRLKKEIALKLEYILFDIYKKNLDKVADEYLQFLNIEKDEIVTQAYHSIMYPFVEKFGAKSINKDIKKIIAKLIDTLIKESPDTYLSNIQTILDLPSKESQSIFYIEENYGIIRAVAQKEKYISRIDFLNNFDKMVNGKNRGKIKERTMLHHVIDKNLWVIDEKFEDVKYKDIASDVSLKTILKKYEMYAFDSQELDELARNYELNKIPDIFIPIEKEDIIYIIELKKPKMQIKRKTIDEIMDKYTKTLKEINKKLPETKRKKIHAIAISDSKTDNVYTMGDLDRDGIRIEPLTWREVIEHTRKRYSKKIEDLDHKLKQSRWRSMKEFINDNKEY